MLEPASHSNDLNQLLLELPKLPKTRLHSGKPRLPFALFLRARFVETGACVILRAYI
jgi:hypothetical protein